MELFLIICIIVMITPINLFLATWSAKTLESFIIPVLGILMANIISMLLLFAVLWMLMFVELQVLDNLINF